MWERIISLVEKYVNLSLNNSISCESLWIFDANRPLQWTAKYYFKISPQKQIKKCKVNTNSYFYHLLTNTGIIFSKVFSKQKVQKKMHKHFCFQSVTNSEWDFHWFSLPFTCTIKMHTIVCADLWSLFSFLSSFVYTHWF